MAAWTVRDLGERKMEVIISLGTVQDLGQGKIEVTIPCALAKKFSELFLAAGALKRVELVDPDSGMEFPLLDEVWIIRWKLPSGKTIKDIVPLLAELNKT